MSRFFCFNMFRTLIISRNFTHEDKALAFGQVLIPTWPNAYN